VVQSENKHNSIGDKMIEEGLIPHPTFIGIPGELSLEGLLKNGMGLIIGKTNYERGNTYCI